MNVIRPIGLAHTALAYRAGSQRARATRGLVVQRSARLDKDCFPHPLFPGRAPATPGYAPGPIGEFLAVEDEVVVASSAHFRHAPDYPIACPHAAYRRPHRPASPSLSNT